MNPEFKKNKYLIVKNIIPKNFCDIVINYAKFQALYSFTPETGETAQVPDTHSHYGDYLMESMLLYLQPIVEQRIGRSLFPTYSYYRAYKQNDDLKPHTDRHACEVSISVAFGWPDSSPWAFKLANDIDYSKNSEQAFSLSGNEPIITVLLNPGDGLIYAGPDVKHWRDPLEGPGYVQAFFHYVYADGPNASLKFDGRTAIGQPLNLKL